jgi:integral membrane protein (TIGR00529 family)
MYVLIVMGLALGLLVTLMHLQVKIGRAMIAASLALTVLLRVTPASLWHTLVYEWQNKPLHQSTVYLWITLTGLILFVNVLGLAMKEAGVSQQLAPALQGIFKSRRFALAAIPMIMGLLPTPGGIMLSAPMVRDLGDSMGVDRSRQAAINFMFRHLWETVWPLFPAVPLVQGMLGVSALALISHNMAVMLAGALGGLIFLLVSAIPKTHRKQPASGHFTDHVRNFLHALWPIALVVGLYAGLNLPPALGLLLTVLAFMIWHGIPRARWWPMFKAGFEPDFALLILGAMFFKLSLQAGQAVDSVAQFLYGIGAPQALVIFVLPFTVAFLTGVTMPSVAMSFPFLVPFIGTGEQARLGLEALAFSGILCGLLLTPVHLCLPLSAGYFACPLPGIIRRMLWPAVFVAGAGVLMAFLVKA